MAAIDEPSYLRLEICGYGEDPDEVPLTSYLRLGAVGAVPDQVPGLKVDPGEDLALYVTRFADDDRAWCDPPELDAAVTAGSPADVAAPTEAALSQLKAELDAAAKLASETAATRDAVVPDPEAWLEAFVALREEAAAALAGRQAELDAALERAAASLRAAQPDVRLPPHYCAPGKTGKSEEEAARPADEAALAADAPAQPAPFTRYKYKVERHRRTEDLHRTGGWRDHTDGNRISTTRGDKLEVVGGNYRLVVLGRTDDPMDADGNPVLPGWDISGGHIHLRSATRVVPQHALGWTQRWNGTWHAFERTLKGDTSIVTVGDRDDQHHGHWTRNTIGSETPDAWHEPIDCPGGACRANPRIVDRTWVEELVHHSGSEARRIPNMRESTFADAHTSRIHADSHTDQRIGGSFETRVEARRTRTQTRAGTMSTTTTAGRIHDRTIVGQRVATTIAGLCCTMNLGAVKTTTLGLHADVFLGLRTNLTLAGCATITAGAIENATIGVDANLTLAASVVVALQGQDQITSGPQSHVALGPSTDVTLVFSMRGAHIEVG